jgi:hypothetical protein
MLERFDAHDAVRQEVPVRAVQQHPPVRRVVRAGGFGHPQEPEILAQLVQTDAVQRGTVRLNQVEIHQRPVADLDPGAVRFDRRAARLLFNPGSLDVVGLGRCVGDDDGAEEKQHAGHGGGEQEKRSGDAGQADAAASHGGDLAVPGEDAEGQQRGHQHGQGGDLKEDRRRSQRKILREGDEFDVIPDEPSDFLEEVNDQIDGHEAGQAHAEDLGQFAQHVSE